MGAILIKPSTRAPKTTNYPAWEYALLQKLNAPANAITLIGLNLWAKSEGMPATENNPLAITNPKQEFGPDAGTVNTSGVVRFKNMQQGVDATANFLSAPTYDAIVTAFQRGTSLNEIFHAINSSPWCAGCENGNYPVALSSYAGKGPISLGSVPIFHGGSPSGVAAVTGGAAESASGFYQCNKSTTIVGGLGFHVLDACTAKALVGGLLVGVGAVLVVLSVASLARESVFSSIGGPLGSLVGRLSATSAPAPVAAPVAPVAAPAPTPNDQRDAGRREWERAHGKPWSESPAGRGSFA